MTAAVENQKISVDDARSLCQQMVDALGGDYTTDEDQSGLVGTALSTGDTGDVNFTDDEISQILEGFIDAYNTDGSSLQDKIDPAAATYLAGVDEADDGDKTWSDAMSAGEDKYSSCWDEEQQAGTLFGVRPDATGSNIDPALFDNFA